MDRFSHSESFRFCSMSIARLVFEFDYIPTCYQPVIANGPNLWLALERSIYIVQTKDGYFLARLFEYFPAVIMSISKKNIKKKKFWDHLQLRMTAVYVSRACNPETVQFLIYIFISNFIEDTITYDVTSIPWSYDHYVTHKSLSSWEKSNRKSINSLIAK